MGSFLTNYQVRSDDAAAVRDAVTPLVRTRAYVSPPKNGWVTVYDEKSDEQHDAVLRKIAMGLSQALKTTVFAFLVHDSDILAYWLYHAGDPVDEFNSDPEYFGKRINEATRARLRGNTDALLPLCVPGTTREQIDAVIHDPEGGPVFAEELFVELASLLGIDEARVTVGFRYFNDEGAELLPDIDEFEPVGTGAERKEPSTTHADEEPAGMVDQFAFAVAMLTQEWTVNENMQTLMQILSSQGGGDPIKKLRAQFDRSAQHVFRHSSLPGRPTFEELKAARDRGPEALAELIAQRTPDQLTAIGIGAAANSCEEFIAALLRHGLNPMATNAQGVSALSVAGNRNRNSRTYQLLKSAAERQGGGNS